jgi:hypothetical protein
MLMALAKDRRNTWELVQCADLAVRTASVLRQMSAGRAAADAEALSEALIFLDRAQGGGAFITEGIAQMSGQTLRPFNWATDTYLQATTSHTDTQPDYPRINEYLGRITSTIHEIVVTHNAPGDKARLNEATLFFETLGDIVGRRADYVLSGESVATLLS